MMKYKKIMLVILIFFILISFSSADAAEINSTSISQNEHELCVGLDNNSYTLSDFSDTGTFTELNNKIKNTGNELKLTKNYAYTDNDSELINGIIIEKPITIDGNGFTINGNQKSIALTIKSSPVILKNIHFNNCKGGTHRAIIFQGVTKGEISNCTFTDGGSIYAYSSNLKIENTNVIGNNIYSGFATYGGCIYADSSNIKIRNANFIENIGGPALNSNGGCIYARSSNMNIENSSFIGNNVRSLGGAIYIRDSILNMNSTNFIRNKADDGGSIYAHSSSLKIENSSFIENNAIREGGSIYVQASMLILKSCNFTNNEARYNGAALYFSPSMGLLENCKFKNNNLDGRTSPLKQPYIQNGCLINCDFENSDINMTIGGNLRNITKLEVNITNNIVDITVINPNYYDWSDYSVDGYYLTIEKYPFPTSHDPLPIKYSLKLDNNHVITKIEDITLGLNQYRVYYSNIVNDIYYYFNITRTAQSSISVEPITAQRGTEVILKIKTINVKDNIQKGYVKLKIDEKTYNSSVAYGDSEIKITMPKKVGTFNYDVTFIPFSEYVLKSSTNLKIVSKYGTKLIIKSVSGTEGKKVKLTATLKTDDDKVIKNTAITFTINGKIYKTKTNSKGIAQISIKFPKTKIYKTVKKTKGNILTKTSYYKKIYSCKVSFNGNGNYLDSYSTFNVTSKKKPTVAKYRHYKYKTITIPYKSGYNEYTKGNIGIAFNDGYYEGIHIIAIVAVNKKTKTALKISTKLHTKYPNGKWHWDQSWEPYTYYKGYPMVIYNHNLDAVNKIKIRYYEPYYKKIK